VFFFAYVDRVNVSFAAIDMRRDLSISASAYGLGAGIFFLGYFVFEVPGNYLLVRVGARAWLSICMVAWGLISAAMAFVTSGTELLIVRFLLGVAESGFYPGILFFLMQAFPPRWHARVISYLIIVIPVSSAISALLSGLIFRLGGTLTLHGWQWLFLLEGLPSILLGVVIYLYLPNRVEEASWLTSEERSYLSARQNALRSDGTARTFHSFISVAGNPVVWKLACIFFCISFVNGTIHFWLPQMVASVGFDRQDVMRLVTIPYILGGVALIVCASRSASTGNAKIVIAVSMVAACTCLLLTAVIGNIVLQGCLITLAVAALFIVLGLMWVVPGQFLEGARVAAGVALINSFGNLGNFFGPTMFSFIVEKAGHYNYGLLLDAFVISAAAMLFVSVVMRSDRQETKDITFI
jgi:ACS family tartrate transporter-like MFS transporter